MENVQLDLLRRTPPWRKMAFVSEMERNAKTTMIDYRSLSADELPTALEQADRTPPLDLIRACLERREELTPTLLTMLEEGSEPDWESEDPRHFRDIHAGLLLCAYREPAALPIFGQVFRQRDRDYLHEWFGDDLPTAYGTAAAPMLLELASDQDTDVYPRASAMEMLTIVAKNHPGEREHIVETLRALLPPSSADGTLPPDLEYSESWTWVASSLSDLNDEASQPQVLALYRAGLIDEGVMGDEKEYVRYFGQSVGTPPSDYDILEIYEESHRQAAREAQRKVEAEKRAAERKAREERADLRAERADLRTERAGAKVRSAPARQLSRQPRLAGVRPKIGRNQPCPCGSGKKYKRCCGRRR